MTRHDAVMPSPRPQRNVLERTIYAVFITLFIGACALSSLYLHVDANQMKKQFIRGLALQMRDMLLSEVMDEPYWYLSRYEHIQAFGVYDAIGNAVFLYGDAPHALTDFQADYLEWNLSEGMVSYSERTESLLRMYSPSDSRYFTDSSWPMLMAPNPYHVLYVRSELPTSIIWGIRIRYMAMAALMLTLAVGIILIRHFFRYYLKISENFAMNQQLIVLGTAVRTLAHEIKNPLGAIRLQTALLRKGGDLAEGLEVIEEEVDRLSTLMDRTRTFLSDPVGQPISLSVQELFQTYPKRFPSGISWNCPDAPMSIRMDTDRFHSVIENLLSNALESGSEISKIRVDAMSEGRMISISVADEGQGISPETLTRIKDPFFTTKSQGLGMGLMLVSRFIKAANGQLLIQSERDEGTSITLKIPRA
ncbi:MAG: HAMP domain-containing histidine kinase [Spirochaetales bacterium]|nr:HAMP domain-containing histidine kinase [Spirochaetales bacterium]